MFDCVRVHLAFGLIYTEFRYIISRYPKCIHTAISNVYMRCRCEEDLYRRSQMALRLCFVRRCFLDEVYYVWGICERQNLSPLVLYTGLRKYGSEIIGGSSAAAAAAAGSNEYTHAQSARGRVGSGRVLYTLNCTI